MVIRQGDQVVESVFVVLRTERLGTHAADIRERVARLEATRDADRAQVQAELSRFRAEVERAALHFERLLPRGEEEKPPPRRLKKSSTD